MGYLRPTAIIVTGNYGDNAERAHAKAVEIFHQPEGFHGPLEVVTPLTPPLMNSSRSFLVAWDGSKEGWSTSDVYDARRAEFIEYLRGEAYDDGSSPLDWIEVQYGGDDGEAIALAHGGDLAHDQT